MFSQRTKTWTFPNLKAPAGPAEVYLAVEEEDEEPVTFGSPFRAVLLSFSFTTKREQPEYMIWSESHKRSESGSVALTFDW